MSDSTPPDTAARRAWQYDVTLHADRTEVVAVCDCNWLERFYDYTPFGTIGGAITKHLESHRAAD